MNEFKSSPEQDPALSLASIPPGELSEFLHALALIYSSDVYGNSRLAAALKELATKVGRRDPAYVRASKPRGEPVSELKSRQFEQLKTLSSFEVEAFLAVETKTKADLLALASARFSMPTSQLKRMRTEEVRAAINSALLHESSIEILSSEAGRDGANRKS